MLIGAVPNTYAYLLLQWKKNNIGGHLSEMKRQEDGNVASPCPSLTISTEGGGIQGLIVLSYIFFQKKKAI